MAKSGRLELGDNIYGRYRSVFNQCDVIGQQINRIRWKNAQGCYTAHGHSRSSRSISIESPYATSYLWLLETDILCRTVSELSQVTVHILGTLRFWATLWGLGTTYDVHLGLIGKRVVNFFSLCVTVEALWAKIDRKSTIWPQRGQLRPKISGRKRRPPAISFARSVRPMNALRYSYRHCFRRFDFMLPGVYLQTRKYRNVIAPLRSIFIFFRMLLVC